MLVSRTQTENNTIKRYDFLPQEGADRKYVEKMVPGYTGIDHVTMKKFKN